MSFIDLMANDVWSNHDIDNRVQALIRSRYTQQDELKASRLTRTTNTSQEEIAWISDVDTWIATCIQSGRDARQDMNLLLEVFLIETAERRLEQPLVEAIVDEKQEEDLITNQKELDQDLLEREEATLIVSEATIEVMELVRLRNPIPEEEVDLSSVAEL
jgi:hypothetical protein